MSEGGGEGEGAARRRLLVTAVVVLGLLSPGLFFTGMIVTAVEGCPGDPLGREARLQENPAKGVTGIECGGETYHAMPGLNAAAVITGVACFACLGLLISGSRKTRRSDDPESGPTA